MFVLCPQCHFLVGIDPRSGRPPLACPKCGATIAEPVPVGTSEPVQPPAGLDPFAPASLPSVAPILPVTDDDAAPAPASADSDVPAAAPATTDAAAATEAVAPAQPPGPDADALIAALAARPPRKARARTRRETRATRTTTPTTPAPAPVVPASEPTEPAAASTASRTPTLGDRLRRLLQRKPRVPAPRIETSDLPAPAVEPDAPATTTPALSIRHRKRAAKAVVAAPPAQAIAAPEATSDPAADASQSTRAADIVAFEPPTTDDTIGPAATPVDSTVESADSERRAAPPTSIDSAIPPAVVAIESSPSEPALEPASAPRVTPASNPEPEPLAEPNPASAVASSPEPAPAPRIEPAPVAAAATSTPSFAQRPRPRPALRHRRRALAAATGLALLLGLQLLLAQRDALAARASWRPTIAALCSWLRCELAPWREPTAFTMLSRHVRPHPGAPGTLLIDASFRNDARWPQPWPQLLLTLSDLDGRTVGARAFAANEYLGATPTQSELAPGQTASIRLAVVEPAPNVVAFSFDFR